MLIGDEPFNSMGKFSIFKDLLNDEERILHSDYARLLFTTGILGLILYIIIFRKIYKTYKTYISNMKLTPNLLVLKGTFLAVFISIIVVGFTGSLFLSFPGLIPYLYLGALLGVIRHQYLIQH